MTPPATAAAARRAAARAPARAAPRARPRAPQRAPRPSRARAASARRAPRARATSAPLPARLVPLAVGGTAAAVSGLADTGLFVRLTRGRLWIGLLAVLLVGIVATNVLALSFGATASRLGQEADGLQRANSAMRARLAGKLSDQRVQAAAIRAGLAVPEPGAIRYLRWQPGDARRAAQRLEAGMIADTPPAASSSPTTIGTGTTTVAAPTAAGSTSTATAPATTSPTVPTTTAPSTAASTTTTAPTTATAAPTGGVAAP
jgi:hypothetical protein